MKEEDWVKTFTHTIQEKLQHSNKNIFVKDGYRIPYSYEIKNYKNDEPQETNFIGYATDILIGELEETKNSIWKPRIIIETKKGGITTHDAITYSQKAQTHKNVHPYLRYGILIGKLNNLPGRLFRHGQHFDFMVTWDSLIPSENEMSKFIKILDLEIEASRKLEEIIFDSRLKNREKYKFLHKPLKLF